MYNVLAKEQEKNKQIKIHTEKLFLSLSLPKDIEHVRTTCKFYTDRTVKTTEAQT